MNPDKKIVIYNTLTRKKEEFKPLRKGKVSMYVCGPTVYDEPHLGHARSAYVFDVISRYFKYKGYKVKFIRNVTDVDDKIINKAKDEFKGISLNEAVKKVADKYLKVYHKYMDQLEIGRPDVEPKATEYIDKMKLFIGVLIQRKVAYESEGDVYFDMTKAKTYGKLSHQSLDMMDAGARVSPGEKKKNPLDFALWKKAKEDEPAWDSPWGRGRPGWHIECSVMSSDILGNEFDIHGGGLDLIFPHHENEIVQSQGAGKKFARYWIHNGLLTINKEKMAKSLGNFITIREVLDKKYPIEALKLLFLQTHYSHPVDFSWEKMEEVKKAYERIVRLLEKIGKKVTRYTSCVACKQYVEIEDSKNKFVESMDDDFNMPKGLTSIFALVNLANRNIDDLDFVSSVLYSLQELLAIFSMSLKNGDKIFKISEKMGKIFWEILKNEKKSTQKTFGISKEDIGKMIAKRNEARANKDYSLADRIRTQLQSKGVILEDTKEGTAWRQKL